MDYTQASERQLEDWVCANIGMVTGDPRAELVGRQIPLVNGMILDVLALVRNGDGCDIVVIELKRQVIDEAAVAQLLTYMGIIHHGYMGVSSVVMHHYGDGTATPVTGATRGLVVAPEITPAACHMLSAIRMVEYRRVAFSEMGVLWGGAFDLWPEPRHRERYDIQAWAHLDRLIVGPLHRLSAVAEAEPSEWEERRRANSRGWTPFGGEWEEIPLAPPAEPTRLAAELPAVLVAEVVE